MYLTYIIIKHTEAKRLKEKNAVVRNGNPYQLAKLIKKLFRSDVTNLRHELTQLAIFDLKVR